MSRQEAGGSEGTFSPAGLKVLVVDDDPMCLKVVSAMLKRCNYEVDTESNGHQALDKLRQMQENGCQFDLVLSDVYMPDMDGFKLLESIGLELEVPVIMMSSDSDTNVVLRGVTHGAVDFLIKPVRIEELRNVWQHVIRRRSSQMSRGATAEESGVEQDINSRTSQGTKRKDVEVIRAEHEGGSTGKKPRVVWSVEMHQQFVYAVNTLGIDKAVPKRILDLMNVEGLTRENVASHLQKYRLYLKRVEGVAGKGNVAVVKGGVPRNVDRLNGKPPLQNKVPKQSKSSGTSRAESSDAERKLNTMHASGSSPNLQGISSSHWSQPHAQMNQPHGYYNLHGQIYGNSVRMNATGAPPMMGWQNQNGVPMAAPIQYANVPSTSAFYQGTGHMYPAQVPPINGQMGVTNNNNVLHSAIDSSQRPSCTEAHLNGSTNVTGNAPGSDNEFDTVVNNNTNVHSSTDDASPNKIATDILRSGSSGLDDDGLPNIAGLDKNHDPDDDVLDMFIKGMEGET